MQGRAQAAVPPGAQGGVPGPQQAVVPGGPRQGLPEQAQESLLSGPQDPDQGGVRPSVLTGAAPGLQQRTQAGNFACIVALNPYA